MANCLLFLSALIALATAQDPLSNTNPNTFPHNYTGIPNGGYGTAWQSYFEVTDPLPNVTDPLPRSFAGSISVNRANHPNDTLFFWAFEKENGSLTANANELSEEPWLIWLNGGPGSSSFLGFMTENGPLHVTNTYSIVQNNFSWNQLADAIWVDQPVGTGYSTSDTTGYVQDEDQMSQDFLGFLTNLVKVFPSLATRPFYLTGESYAGVYIPYITKALFSTPNPPVKLRKFAIGDGSIGSLSVFEELPALSVIETYPQLINYDQDVFNYFKTQEHLCGFDLNLTYPQQNGTFPTLEIVQGAIIDAPNTFFNKGEFSLRSDAWNNVVAQRYAARLASYSDTSSSISNRETQQLGARIPQLSKRELLEREENRLAWKRDLSGRANGTIDPFYGCFLFDEMIDYAVNFSFPWTNGGFDVYDIPDGLNPEAPSDASVFLNDDRTRTAIHAPTSKNWTASFNYPFGSTSTQSAGANEFGDPSVEPMAFLTELATNATANNVSMIVYSGNDDSLVAHRGTEVVIQNMTFGGIQGFTRKPSTPWFDDSGNFAGIVHQERNVTYVLFAHAGHLVPEWVPAAAFVFLREFVLGSNTTGLVSTSASGTVSVSGGENSTLADDILPGGGNAIFYGAGTTSASTIAPAATLAAWESFLQTATAVSTAVSTTVSTAPTSTVGSKNDAMKMSGGLWGTWVAVVVAVVGIYVPGL